MVLKLMVLLILWIFYAVLEGIREGAYWHYKNGKSKYRKTKGKEHTLWTIQRSLVIMLATYLSGNFYYFFVFTLVFPFWHDGFYYFTRRELSYNKNTYRKGFWDFSHTSTAYFTRYSTPVLRSLYFIYGVSLFIYLTF